MIRTLWLYSVSLLATVVYASGVLLHNMVNSSRFRVVADQAPTKWGKAVLRAANVDVKVEGFEHYQEGQAQVIVSNHVSWFDVFALAAVLPPGIRFVAKKELSKIPIFGPAWVAAGHYAVDRSNREAAVASLNQAAELIRQGKHTLVMFAEGTRSEDGQLKTFKKGAFVLAIGSGAPILPVAVLGTREVMAKGSWAVRPGTITVRFGPPIPTTGMTLADRDILLKESWNAVAGMLGQTPAPSAVESAPSEPTTVTSEADARSQESSSEHPPVAELDPSGSDA